MEYEVLNENRWVLLKKEEGKTESGLIRDEMLARVISAPTHLRELHEQLVVYNENQVTPYKGYMIVPIDQIYMVVRE